jgi:PAS domain S-box-containing protein
LKQQNPCDQVDTQTTIETLYRIINQKQQKVAAAELGDDCKAAEMAYVTSELVELTELLQKAGGARITREEFLNHCLLLTSSRLLHAIQNLNYGICVCDENNKIISLNQRLLDLFNSPVNPIDLIGMQAELIMGEMSDQFRNSERFIEEVSEIAANRSSVTGVRCKLSNGNTLVVDYSPIWNNNVFLGDVWMFDDITARLATEEKLEEQRKFYEDVLNMVPSDLVVLNTEREYLFANQMAFKDPNVREWIIGKRDEDYFRLRQLPDDLLNTRISVINEVLRTGELQTWEEKFVDNAGNAKYQLRYMYPVIDENGKVKLLIGYGMDITKHKSIEDQITRSEKRYRDLFNYSQALICTHDLEGRFRRVNPAICALLEYEEDEIVGKLISDYIPEEHRSNFKSVYLDPILDDGKCKGVFSVLTKSGQTVYLLYKNYKVEEDGMEPYIIGFSQDISDRVESEKQLIIAKKITEDTAKAKETFLANMSHEIRTPMNGVLGFANLLVKTDLNEQQRDYLKMIQESANNLLMIVNDVLDLEKIVMGKLKFEHIDFSITERVELCLQSFTYKAQEKGVALKTSMLIDNDLRVIGDPFRLSQVLNNLIGNAVKFTTKGSIIVIVSVIQSDDVRTWLRFSVKDTGIGIPKEKHQVIFEPFMQANTAVTRTYGGTGLGLSISRELIQMMGGELSLKSAPGEGSEFSFLLPFEISVYKPKHQHMSQEINYRSLGKRKILVAEDVELNQYLARHIMESWGFEVDIAVNGREAFEKVQRGDYDLILMDIQMPEMDGMEATTQIRGMKNQQIARIPIIALTANALKGDSEKYMAVGMNDYLSKPFDEARLFMAISRNLAGSGQHAAVLLQNNSQAEAIKVVPQSEQAESTEQPVVEATLYDLKMVEAISGGDRDFVIKMVRLFLETMPASLRDIEDAADNERWDDLSKLAHKLKSTIDSMGIITLKQLVRTIENNSKNGTSPEELPSQVGELVRVMRVTMRQVQRDFSL